MRPTRRYALAVAMVAVLGVVPGVLVTMGGAPHGGLPTSATPTAPPVRWCATGFRDPYTKPPTGAIVVRAGNNSNEPFAHTWTAKRRVTYWFAPGKHTLGRRPYANIGVADGDVFVGAPGAVIDGGGLNRYAFESTATGNPLTSPEHATIEYLTVTHFNAGTGEMVVGQGGYDGWTIKDDTIVDNRGAGVALGSNAIVEDNCLARNAEYGYSSLGRATHILFTHNDVFDNNRAGYYDIPGSTVQCGCSGGGKFWMSTDATVTDNYVHANIGTGIWVDTDNAGFTISGNYIAGNWSSGIIYEISYNGEITDNALVGNDYGDVTTNASPSFPAAAIYISESGNQASVPSAHANSPLLVQGNILTNNWGGVVLYQNGDRVCGFSADGICTRPVNSTYTLASCRAHLQGETHGQAVSQRPDYYDGCRWKTQNVAVVGNTVSLSPSQLQTGPFAGHQTCAEANAQDDTLCGYNGLFSTYSTIKPYTGSWEPWAISDQQHDVFQGNVYEGPIRFVAFDQGDLVSWSQWSNGFVDGYSHHRFDAQDRGSRYSA